MSAAAGGDGKEELDVAWVAVKEEDAAVWREAVPGPEREDTAALVEMARGDRAAAVVGTVATIGDRAAAVLGTAAAIGGAAVGDAVAELGVEDPLEAPENFDQSRYVGVEEGSK